MNSWYRRLQVLLCTGGGFTGFVLTARQFFALKTADASVYVSDLVFVGVCLYAIILGVSLGEGKRCRRQLLILYILQLFTIYSPLLTYHCYIGMDWFLGIYSWKVIYDFGVGAAWFGTLLKPQHWGVGINLFAVLVIITELVAWNRRIQDVSVVPEAPVPPMVELPERSL